MESLPARTKKEHICKDGKYSSKKLLIILGEFFRTLEMFI